MFRQFITPLLLCIFSISFTLYSLKKDLFQDPLEPFLKKQKPFVTVKFRGELGNQMFQVAAGLALALENKAEFILPKKNLTLKKEGASTNMKEVFFRLPVRKISRYQIRHKHHEEVFAPFSKIPFKPNLRLAGYYESEKHFRKYRNIIQKVFAPSEKTMAYLEKNYASILHHPKSVAIHVRTFYKDYLKDGITFYEDFPAPTMEYFEKAMSLFDEDCLFVVFSDYIPWCKKNFSHLKHNLIFIENEPYYHDFYLMSRCKHVITSPSSFSWWAAYLNPNPNKRVIARTPWALEENRVNDDIFLEDWELIEVDPHPTPPKF